MSKRVSMEEAFETARLNVESRPPKRGEANNRLEPECWPTLRPSFTFDKNSSIFVIGSCFASNIEQYLSEKEYNLCSLVKGLNPGALNKYTPASIYEEVKWARDILERDDTVSTADAQKCFFRLPDGRVCDVQLHQSQPKSEEEAIEARKIVYHAYRQLFSCDVVIITLGLIEAWYDTVTGRYICETPSKWLAREKGRFQFETLDFDTCMQFMRQAIELISRDRTPRMLVTTSPVVLGRTFTNDDVLVANMYSKSVLRAVTGQIVRENDFIDYFPSYESVMLTRKSAVWRDDFMHVSESFVKQIMARVERTYSTATAEGELSELDTCARFVAAIQTHDFDAASSIYAELTDPFSIGPSEFHTAAAIMFMKSNDRMNARRHLDIDPGPTKNFADSLFSVRLCVVEWLDGREEVERVLQDPAQRRLTIAAFLFRGARWLFQERMFKEAAALVRRMDPKNTPPHMLNLSNRILLRAGETELASRFVAA